MLVRFAAALALIVLPVFSLRGPAGAQLAVPTAGPTPAPGGIRQEGAYFTAPISVDGKELFRIANSIAPSSLHLPIAQRQAYVQNAIAEILASRGSGLNSETEYDPRTLRVRTVGGGDVAALVVTDSRHRDPLSVVTVTSIDARYNRDSIDDVASEWQDALQGALTNALELRQPLELAENLRRVGLAALALALLTLVLAVVLAALDRRIKTLRTEVDAKTDAVDAQISEGAENQEVSGHQAHRNMLALSLSAIKPAQQLALYRATSATLYASINLVWFVMATWAFSLFPLTEPLGRTLTNDLLAITVTILVTIFLDRLLDLAIARGAKLWGTASSGDSENRARQALRVPTISSAVRAIKSLILVFVAGLAILTQIGIPVGSVVTIGGLVALALSLATQSFVRDFLNGALVLVEDQYVVGDYIAITPSGGGPTFSGTVERLTLRVVQIRDANGSLITIPHSAATTVVNKSRNWSRVDYRIPVDPASDIPKAIDIIKTGIDTLGREPEWQGIIHLPLDLIGIDELSKDWVVIRASVKTAPLRQFEIRRQLNARVRVAFAEAGIAFGAQIPED